MLVTSLPDPRLDCRGVTENFFTTFRLHRCGDCIFSGHTAVLVVMLLYWLSHEGPAARLTRYFRHATLMFFLAGIWAILANRAHYTVDIVVAVYTSAGVWWSHAYFWQTLIAAKGRFVSASVKYRVFNANTDYLKQ